jgi:hypothetical protein
MTNVLVSSQRARRPWQAEDAPDAAERGTHAPDSALLIDRRSLASLMAGSHASMRDDCAIDCRFCWKMSNPALRAIWIEDRGASQ